MRLLITGATGFIGRACVCAALAHGHQVAAFVRASSPPLLNSAITRIEGDLAQPNWAAMEAFAPESCLHAAWITTPGEYLQSSLNTAFHRWSLTLLRGLVERGVCHSLVLGTCLEYAPQREPLREDVSPLERGTPYAACKDALRKDLQREGFALAWARVFYPFGPGEDPRRLASTVIRHALKHEAIVLKTPDSIKDYIFIEDLAEALLTLLEKRFLGVVNVGSGMGVTVREVVATVGRVLERPLHIIVPQPAFDSHEFVVADLTRLHALGWQPHTTLAEGLSRLVRSLAL